MAMNKQLGAPILPGRVEENTTVVDSVEQLLATFGLVQSYLVCGLVGVVKPMIWGDLFQQEVTVDHDPACVVLFVRDDLFWLASSLDGLPVDLHAPQPCRLHHLCLP